MFGGAFLLSSIVYYIPLSLYGEPNTAMYVGLCPRRIPRRQRVHLHRVFISSLTENQFISALGTIGAIVLLLFISSLNSYINNEFIRNILSGISITSRYAYFANGIFSYDSLIYFVSLSAVFLFLTVRIFEKRRWSKS